MSHPSHSVSSGLAGSRQQEPFESFRKEVIEAGLCTHCGTCVGLSSGKLAFELTEKGPLPVPTVSGPITLPAEAWQACPGRGLDYPKLSEAQFGGQPDSWLTGPVLASFLGYSADPAIRRAGASGGVLTHILAALVEDGDLEGAIVLKHGYPEPWTSAPIIATSADEILASSQSVYIPTPVNTILAAVEGFEGRLGYVGLPDQVASIRQLQAAGNPAAMKIELMLGPYVGTSMYHSALMSYLRSHGDYQLKDVEALRYREGEWPGNLMVCTRDGTMLRSAKFYYNYLIPFFITRACLLTMDFTNELTDISVGDAWSPALEAKGEGYSVVLARSQRGLAVLERLGADDVLTLEPIELKQALTMHGHMLDFKKRGSYIRAQFRRWLGQPAPRFSIAPKDIGISRYVVEAFIFILFSVGATKPARWTMERIPSSLLGPVFDWLRQKWKSISKPVKREGIWGLEFELRGEQQNLGAGR